MADAFEGSAPKEWQLLPCGVLEPEDDAFHCEVPLSCELPQSFRVRCRRLETDI